MELHAPFTDSVSPFIIKYDKNIQRSQVSELFISFGSTADFRVLDQDLVRGSEAKGAAAAVYLAINTIVQ